MKSLCCLLLLLSTPGLAQETKSAAHAVAEGVAPDSLRGGGLRGAFVTIVGTGRMAATDSLGRFRIDSVPPGMHAVELFHDVLDTVGLRVMTEPLAFHAGAVTHVTVGVPSAETILRSKCPNSRDGEAAIMGMVLGADSEDPVAGAQVSLSWMETTVSREVGIRRQAQQRAEVTDPAGRYRFCGLPSDLEATLMARSEADSTSPVTVRLGQAVIGMATLYLADHDSATAPGPAAQVGSATVRGVVVDSAGQPVRGVRVGFASRPEATVTDSAGTFSLNTQQSGTHVLVARRIGYQPAETVVNLTRRMPREVVLRLSPFVPVLEAVYIEARRNAALERVGFANRQRSGFGRYLGPEDLAKRYASVVSDYLRHLPPARVSGFSNRSCTTFWVDGIRWHEDPSGAPAGSYDVDYFVSPSEVAAIEVYNGTTAPAEFQSFDGGCRVVVIWTKWKLGVR